MTEEDLRDPYDRHLVSSSGPLLPDEEQLPPEIELAASGEVTDGVIEIHLEGPSGVALHVTVPNGDQDDQWLELETVLGSAPRAVHVVMGNILALQNGQRGGNHD